MSEIYRLMSKVTVDGRTGEIRARTAGTSESTTYDVMYEDDKSIESNISSRRIALLAAPSDSVLASIIRIEKPIRTTSPSLVSAED